MLSYEGKRIRTAIRALMKRNGFQYKDLAKVLKVSVPTVKRIMTRDDLTLERLISISEWLGISIVELIALSEEHQSGSNQFSTAQETYLAQSPKAFLVFHQLLTGRSISQVRDRYRLKPVEARKVLKDLEKIGLIEVWPNDRVRLRCRGFFSMTPGGALEKAYFNSVVTAIWNNIRSKAQSYSSAKSERSVLLFRPFELTLLKETYFEMTRDLEEILTRYRSLSGTQIAVADRSKLKSYAGILMADEYYPWNDTLQIK